jgi:HK97 family phage major capsid protein
MDNIEMLQKLIDKSDDEQEIKELKRQQLEAIAERERAAAREEAQKELEEKFSQEREDLEQKNKSLEERMEELKRGLKIGEFPEDAKVEVGEPAEYRGYNLKRAKEAFVDIQRKRGNHEGVERTQNDKFDHLMKTFTDLVANSHQKADMVGGTDTLGGYLVPDDDRTELLAYARLNSVALRDARTIQMGSDVMTMPREDAKVNLTFQGETDAISETSATFDQVTLTAGDLDGYADVSIHLEQDTQTPGGIVGVLLDQFTEAYGQKIDSAVFQGTGDPVSGLLYLDASAGTVAGHSLDLGGTDPSAMSVGSLLTVVGKIPRPRRAGAKWYASRVGVWQYLMNIQDDSKTVFAAMPQQAPQMRAVGYPIEEVEEAPDPATGNDNIVAAFANLNGFLIGDRLTNLTLFRDPYSQRVNKLIRYSFLTRVAFSPALPNNFVIIRTTSA